MSSGQADVLTVREWVHGSSRIVALTGAGISTDSGIPDFRGPQGTWTRNPEAEKMATIRHYLADPEVRRRSWQNRLTSPYWDARPNAGHDALVELERRGKLLALVTQNVDGLHLLAGSGPESVIEIHGNARATMCWSCGDRRPMEEALDRVRAGDEEPACLVCGGILKSTTISFGEPLVATDLARAEEAAASCDLMLAVGTTLTVHPAAGLVPGAAAAGARIVVVNAEPTAYDHLADAVLRAQISDVLPEIAQPVQAAPSRPACTWAPRLRRPRASDGLGLSGAGHPSTTAPTGRRSSGTPHARRTPSSPRKRPMNSAPSPSSAAATSIAITAQPASTHQYGTGQAASSPSPDPALSGSE